MRSTHDPVLGLRSVAVACFLVTECLSANNAAAAAARARSIEGEEEDEEDEEDEEEDEDEGRGREARGGREDRDDDEEEEEEEEVDAAEAKEPRRTEVNDPVVLVDNNCGVDEDGSNVDDGEEDGPTAEMEEFVLF